MNRLHLLAASAASLLALSPSGAALLLHYDFNDGNATNKGTLANGTVAGGSTFVASGAGSNAGLAWSGNRTGANNAFINTGIAANALGYSATGNYTSMAWINWAGPSGSVDHMVFGQDDGMPAGNAAQVHHGIRVDTTAPNIHFGGWGGTQDISDAGTVIAGVWTHVAWQFNQAGVGEAVVYINGVEVNRQDKNNISDAAQVLKTMLIGGHSRDGTALNPYHSFNGQLDDVRIYDTALTAAEIMTARNAVNIPEPSHLALVSLAALGLFQRRRR